MSAFNAVASTPPTARRTWLGQTLAAAGLVSVGGLVQAQSGDGAKTGRGMWGMDPERRLQRRISHMLDRVEASPEQRSKIIAIAKAAHTDLAAMRQKRQASREKGLDMMGAATLDRAGLERVRQEQMTVADAMGQRKLAGLLDTFDVLTPEQRRTVITHVKERGMHRGMGHGMHHGHRAGMSDGAGANSRKP